MDSGKADSPGGGTGSCDVYTLASPCSVGCRTAGRVRAAHAATWTRVGASSGSEPTCSAARTVPTDRATGAPAARAALVVERVMVADGRSGRSGLSATGAPAARAVLVVDRVMVTAMVAEGRSGHRGLSATDSGLSCQYTVSYSPAVTDLHKRSFIVRSLYNFM